MSTYPWKVFILLHTETNGQHSFGITVYVYWEQVSNKSAVEVKCAVKVTSCSGSSWSLFRIQGQAMKISLFMTELSSQNWQQWHSTTLRTTLLSCPSALKKYFLSIKGQYRLAIHPLNLSQNLTLAGCWRIIRCAQYTKRILNEIENTVNEIFKGWKRIHQGFR